MADRISIYIEDDNGAPLVGLLPVPSSDWVTEYRVAQGGAPRTKPLVSEIGDGEYGISPTDADEEAGVVYLITAPAGASPRRFSGAIYTPTNPFIGFHLEDGAGALWAGASPTVGTWRDFDGNPRTPPSVLTPGGTTYLFALIPSAEDLELDVSYKIVAPAGAFSDVTGSLEVAIAPAVRATVGETIRRLLMADAPTVALIGTRLYPQELPQGVTYPAARYAVISDVPESSLTGAVATTLTAARVQIDCYARPGAAGGAYTQAHAVASAIAEVLGNLATPDVSGELQLKRDTYDNVTQLHGVSMDFLIWT